MGSTVWHVREGSGNKVFLEGTESHTLVESKVRMLSILEAWSSSTWMGAYILCTWIVNHSLESKWVRRKELVEMKYMWNKQRQSQKNKNQVMEQWIKCIKCKRLRPSEHDFKNVHFFPNAPKHMMHVIYSNLNAKTFLDEPPFHLLKVDWTTFFNPWTYTRDDQSSYK